MQPIRFVPYDKFFVYLAERFYEEAVKQKIVSVFDTDVDYLTVEEREVHVGRGMQAKIVYDKDGEPVKKDWTTIPAFLTEIADIFAVCRGVRSAILLSSHCVMHELGAAVINQILDGCFHSHIRARYAQNGSTPILCNEAVVHPNLLNKITLDYTTEAFGELMGYAMKMTNADYDRIIHLTLIMPNNVEVPLYSEGFYNRGYTRATERVFRERIRMYKRLFNTFGRFEEEEE